MLFRKLTAAAASAVLLTGLLTGCGSSGERKPEIVTTVYATYDLVRQLTAEYDTPVDVKLLLTPGGESHSYEPSPADAAAVQRCDLFVYIGGASEQWAAKMIDSSRTEKPNLRMFDAVTLLNEETVEGMEPEEEEHAEDSAEPEYDEHIWTSPLNADAMLTALRDELNVLFPAEKPHCDAACEALHQSFTALDAQAKQITAEASGNTLIFADRFPFRYLTEAYGWDYYAAFSGCSSDTDASAATLSFLISKVRELNIGTVFYLENSSQKISDAVCSATGAQAVMMQSGNNVSAKDYREEKHLQDIISDNLQAVREALS